MTTDELKRNIDAVTARVYAAAARAGSSVRIVAATKTVPAEVMNFAVSMGIVDLGENRVNEFRDKCGLVSGCIWHFIGTLQRNKAKYLVGRVALIQSVSSVPLAEEISRLATARGVLQDVLVNVNIGGEASKTGVSEDGAQELIKKTGELGGLRLRGLMAVPPRGADDSTYKRLYRLYEKHASGEFDTLSVGMSGDFEMAIANGSNTVRIGSALFGARTM